MGSERRFQQSQAVRILEADPELGLRIPANHVERARSELVVQVRLLTEGMWEVPEEGGGPGRLGFMLLEGLLARDLILAGKTCTELLGEGDVLQPGVLPRDESLVRYHVRWHVLEPIKLAVLDEKFSRSLGQWPQVTRALLERVVRRTHRTSVHAALLQLSPVETRLVVLFWHLAERWGKVTPDGIALQLRLPHRLLGEMVGCRRASVTTALGHISTSGRVTRRSDGTWLLTGPPPDELAEVRWEQPLLAVI